MAERLLEVPAGLVGTALESGLRDGAVVADRVGDADCVFLARLYRAERAVADRLLALLRRALPWDGIGPDKGVPSIEGQTGLALAESQQGAGLASLVHGLGATSPTTLRTAA